MALRDSGGAQVGFDDDSGPGNNASLLFRPGASGTFYIDVGGFGNTSGGYTVSIREVPASTASYSDLAIGSSTTGVISSGRDQDWHRIQLVAGETYIFDVDGNTLSDPTLALRDASGTLLAFDDDGGLGNDSRIVFTASASGTYYLDVGGFSSLAGSYTVSARLDDIADDTATLAATTVGTDANGNIDSTADQDFIAITLTAGTTYILDVDGGTLGDPTLNLRDSAGALITSNDDGGPGANSRIVFTATTSGTYFLDVGGFSATVGTYTVRSRIDDVPDDIDTSIAIVPGASVAGTIDSAADQDFFRINLVAGTNYSFAVDGGTVDPTLTLRDAAGAELAFDDDSGPGNDSLINFTPTTTGTYFLDVGGFSSTTGSYTLIA